MLSVFLHLLLLLLHHLKRIFFLGVLLGVLILVLIGFQSPASRRCSPLLLIIYIEIYMWFQFWGLWFVVFRLFWVSEHVGAKEGRLGFQKLVLQVLLLFKFFLLKGVQHNLDVLTLYEFFVSLEEFRGALQVIQGRIVLDCFLIQGYKGLDC